MIHIQRPACPKKLTKEVKNNLTHEFINSKKSVWGQTYIKKALLEMSYSKCAYCECKLDKESMYMEVEHFLPKNIYPRHVVEWKNLLPSCKRCNVKKGVHDPNEESIVNPAEDIPIEHLTMSNFRIKGKNEKGKNTVSVLHLNESDRIYLMRVNVGNKAIDTIENLLRRAENIESKKDTSVENRNAVKNGALQLLKEAQKDAEYAATVSTMLFTTDDFFELKETMVRLNLWQDDHQELFIAAEKNTLVKSVHPSTVG
ncbi:HNH endonuclease [Bacillus thuringiensis]|uniref:HNH endonuclease n=1 Tax=Bacillus thuringiensis TaxID=1428 RepID=A0A9X6TMN8_BACTU|nr:HNH endonuclease [Bacillus thuringiensis]PEA89155.1 HNH endonuclease [Bacillus thuringiensis]